MILHIDAAVTDPRVLDLRQAIERSGTRTRAEPGLGSGAVVRCLGQPNPDLMSNESMDFVNVLESTSPYPLIARYRDQSGSVVSVPGAHPVSFGGNEVVVIAGPCSVESRDQMIETASGVRAAGAGALRGGAYKPRTSPYFFEGLGDEGLDYLAEARRITGLPVVTEVMDPRLVEHVAERADVLQIGARNMQNYTLLDEAGRVQRPVLLKRGLSATLEELLLAAERIVLRGNDQVILCERGIRTYETATRNTLDVSAIAVLKERTHLPVIVDPSHAAGRRELVPALALAAIASGADGLLIEVHTDPDQATTDAAQSLSVEAFEELMHRSRPVAEAVGRTMRGACSQIGEAA